MIFFGSTKMEENELEKAYKQGLEVAWNTARKLILMNSQEISLLFGDDCIYATHVLRKFSAEEVMGKKAEIKVGDRLENKNTGERCIVIGFNQESDETFYTILGSDGNTHQFIFGDRKDIDFFTLTGRHFPQVEEMLKAMKEE